MNAADTVLRLNASWVDYSLVALYFVFVLGIGWAAKSKVSSSIDFFLSGRGLPAWVTGLAFISANLGAVEIVGHSANGVQYGFQTMHYFWIGAVPAMVFLGIVMMPFYYGSKVRSVPEFMLRRFGSAAPCQGCEFTAGLANVADAAYRGNHRAVVHYTGWTFRSYLQ